MKIRRIDSVESLDEFTSKERKIFEDRCIFWPFTLSAAKDCIRTGRIRSFCMDNGEKNKWSQELVETLDEAGFLRHDLTIKQFAVGKLYHAAYKNFINLNLNCGEIIPSSIYTMTDCQYENMAAITDGQVNKVREALSARLTPSRVDAVIEYCRLDDRIVEKPWAFGRYKKEIGESMELLRVTRRTWFPPIFESEVANNKLEALIAKADSLDDATMAELKSIASLSPFSCAEKAQKWFQERSEPYVLYDTPTNELGLKIRTCNVLRSGDVLTFSDLLASLDRDLQNIKGIGPGMIQEISDKIHELGYSEYKIN